ncbi:MAG: hypothetical protein QY314_01730 [Candidatus Dojkabacteria bacterium]|nr:MAG: hypothetical protein QY314_01730 [Candidatus Dojkabacteria bacterium]
MNTPRYYGLDSVSQLLPGEEVAIFMARGQAPIIEIVVARTESSATTNSGRVLTDEENDYFTCLLTGNYFPEHDSAARI